MPEENKNEAGAAAWFLRPSLGKDSLNFLTNLFVTFCGQMEKQDPASNYYAFKKEESKSSVDQENLLS